jgi:putative oxidoreductase
VRNILLARPGRSPIGVDVGLLLLRAYSGIALALAHGLQKLPPSQRFVETVGGLGFPWPGLFAYAAGLAEFAGGLLLAIGLLTRPSAFFILITMAVAVVGRHAADPFLGKEKALLYGVVALTFLIAGPGRFAADAILNTRRR